jgi:hypothetical protein
MLDHYSNLILLCRIDHKLVDDQPLTYPREQLVEIKRQHVEWVSTTLSPADREKARDDKIYAEYVEEFVCRADPRAQEHRGGGHRQRDGDAGRALKRAPVSRRSPVFCGRLPHFSAPKTPCAMR